MLFTVELTATTNVNQVMIDLVVQGDTVGVAIVDVDVPLALTAAAVHAPVMIVSHVLMGAELGAPLLIPRRGVGCLVAVVDDDGAIARALIGVAIVVCSGRSGCTQRVRLEATVPAPMP